MKITNKQIAEFAENNDMIALFGDMFELPCGNQIHEAEVEDMIKEGKAMWPDMHFPTALDHLFGDVAGALDSLTITK
jgi:hypothetical protein